MNKNLFTIDDSERQRILEMHQSATNRQYLVEQTGSDFTNWAEDTGWSAKTRNEDQQQRSYEQQLSEENYGRFLKYYHTSERVSNGGLTYYNAIGKKAYLFNNINYPFSKSNLVDSLTFTINNIQPGKANVQTSDVKLFLLSAAPNEPNPFEKPYLAVFPNGKVEYHVNNKTKNTNVTSPVGVIRFITSEPSVTNK